MDPSSQLPLLPSERKVKAQSPEARDDTCGSPSHDHIMTDVMIAISDKSQSFLSADDSSKPQNLISNKPITLRRDEEESYLVAKNEHVELFFNQIRPLSASTSSRQFLRFMFSTTSFMDSFALKLDTKLMGVSRKIGNLELKVHLLQNRWKEQSKNILQHGKGT